MVGISRSHRPSESSAWGTGGMRNPKPGVQRYNPDQQDLRTGTGRGEGTAQAPSGIAHGDLSGLGADDHTQYLQKAGGTFTGAFNISVQADSGASLVLAGKQCYVFTGSSGPTWTLPAVTGNTGRIYYIKNRGSASITLQRAGSDSLYTTTTATSITIIAGASAILVNDGTYWLVLLNA